MIHKRRVALISDLHLGIYSNAEEWHDTAIKWCEWLVDYLSTNGIEDILFLGDFYDNRTEISVHTLHVASKLINMLKDFNIIMIVGNHDAYYKNRSDVNSISILKAVDNIKVIESTETLDVFGKKLCFVPWECPLPDTRVDYLFGHFEINTFKMNDYTKCKNGILSTDILKASKQTFSGHFHNKHSKKYKDGEITYIGSCFPMDFSDVGNPRGIHILNVSDGEVEFVENTVSPKFIRLNLKDVKKFDFTQVTNNIFKIIIEQQVKDETVEKLEKLVWKYKPWRFTIEYNTTKKTVDDIELDDTFTILDMFEEFYVGMKMDEDQEERVKNLVKTLYEDNNI